jgi:hypothetical protein
LDWGRRNGKPGGNGPANGVNLPVPKPAVKNGLAGFATSRRRGIPRTFGSPAAFVTYRTARPTESHQRAQPFYERRTHPTYVTQNLHSPEGTRGIAVCHDARGEGGTDPRKRLDRGGIGAVEVHRSGRRGGSGVVDDARRRHPPLPPDRSGARRIHTLQLLIERSDRHDVLRAMRRAPETDRAPRERDERKEPERLALAVRGHRGTVHAADAPHAIISPPAELKRYRVTSARATSPTTCRLRALTRSIVSPCVWCRLFTGSPPHAVLPSAQ